ncbi:GNAT family N-acetyltransferase [Psychrobium sp. MM17-31]|uniref:GNAT family N-acetyltransferase n=1 Tax=Psychrobium sp. MM17-31 TaxID=2917758 RepID=UPI001EF73FD2|nr:GNAT family N-acetyltransferase [Psychrobium sp. MM17-31]MCG7532577.1 GNAT family N-acetyltransferase [Psychrobium sp. MM17-31]
MTLVLAELRHIDAVVPVMEEYRAFCGFESKGSETEQFLEQIIANQQSKLFLAIDEQTQQVMGFVNLYPSYSTLALKPIWILNDLAVSSHFRGRGLAKELIYGALEFAKSSGAIRVELKTEVTNARAQALYRSLDFNIDSDNVYYRVTC